MPNALPDTAPMTEEPLAWPIGPNGYAIVEGVFAQHDVDLLIQAVSRARGEVYAARNLLREVPEVRALASSPAVRALVEPVLGPDCRAVRGILFDKTAAANWKVGWHQDLVVALRERRECEGFGPWSIKAGVLHAQAPAHVLERMLAVRLHLDDCGPDRGPLRVLPGTHLRGKLDAAAIQRARDATSEVVCVLPQGGALLMRPLLLHASSQARRPGHRRVIHIEFAAGALPGGLLWHDPVGR